MLKIEFKKNRTKPSTLTCFRSDGSNTWTKLNPNLEDHDMAHYAVESILKFREAFFGLIKRGFDIHDYELPNDIKPQELFGKNLPLEAIQAEYIVNLLQTEYWSEKAIPNFIEVLTNTLNSKNIDVPKKLTEENLKSIRNKYHQLIDDWNNLSDGKTLVLEF